MAITKTLQNMWLGSMKAHRELGIIAAVGSRSCVVLSLELEIVQRYLDANKNEKFYCCAFADVGTGGPAGKSVESRPASVHTYSAASGTECIIPENERGSVQTAASSPSSASADSASAHSYEDAAVKNLLCVAGETGIIKILNLNSGLVEGYLKGHTGCVYDLKVVGSTVVSCSEDSTIRLWDIRTYSPIGVIGGLMSHRDHILSIDVHHSRALIASTGTDSTIKQWRVSLEPNSSGAESFYHKPSQNFTGIHRSAITKVLYYGDIVLSLCNNTVLAIYNNMDLDKLAEPLLSQRGMQLAGDQPLYIGKISFPKSCKTIAIERHILAGISREGDIYLYDLRRLSRAETPLIVETRLARAEDFLLLSDRIYVTTGGELHSMALDVQRIESGMDL
ncbi:polycomb protein EED [Pancytospora philotis]|nr:polycomb protein EED [Pancytospora philotis]